MVERLLIVLDLGHLVVGPPCHDEHFRELPTCLDEESPGAHGGVQDLEIQDLLGGREGAQALKDGLEGLGDNATRETPGGVVGASPNRAMGPCSRSPQEE
jgi:hypothetical protein